MKGVFFVQLLETKFVLDDYSGFPLSFDDCTKNKRLLVYLACKDGFSLKD